MEDKRLVGYDVFGKKDGKRNLIKTGMSMAQATRFVERNNHRYQSKGFDYLVTFPTEREENIERKAAPEQKKDWYVQVNFLQFEEDTKRFSELEEKGDYKTILQEARDYDFSSEEDFNLRETRKGYATHYRGDDLLDEDSDYAVVVNNSIGGTYAIFRKVTEEELRDDIIRQGFGKETISSYDNRFSDDVKQLINHMYQEEHSNKESQSEQVQLQLKQPSVEEQKAENIHASNEKGIYLSSQASTKELLNYLQTSDKFQDGLMFMERGAIMSDFELPLNDGNWLHSTMERSSFDMWRYNASIKDKDNNTIHTIYDFKSDHPLEKEETNFMYKNAERHLASFYNQFRLPKEVDVEQTLLHRDTSGRWTVQCDLGELGKTSKHELSFNDREALFSWHAATKEQVAARYLNDEIKNLISEKIEISHSQKENIIQQNSTVMSEEKKPQVKQDNASVEQPKVAPQEKTASEEVKHREPQLVTVNGEKVTHAHAYQSNKNPEDWFYTAKIDGISLRPQHMTAEDVKLYQEKNLKVEDAMQHYYPTKLQKKVTPEEYKADNRLSDGREIGRFNIFKEQREGHEDIGKYKMYVEVGNRKVTNVISHEDLNAYFDRVTTPAKLVEKNFGEQLNLASAYAKYQIPKEAGVERVAISKTQEGKYLISASGSFGQTEKKQISASDVYSLYHSKTATKEQLAAKYFQDGFKPVQSEKQERSRELKR